ncbi:outer membrane lipoprotein-sorting protein [Bacteroidota bacterium]
MKSILFSITAILLNALAIGGQDLDGPQIIQKVNNLMNQETIYAKSTMIILTTSGTPRTFEYESWSKDYGEKNLMKYLSPSRVKGQATLMLNHADDIWVYFPRTQRVRKLATHAKKQKMEGSDFSYEDMGSGNSFIEEFSAKRLEDEKKEGKDCFKLEMTRKPESNLSYSRLVMWVNKEDFVPLVIDYYDEKDPEYHLKTLIQSDIEVIDGIPTAKQIIMYNKVDNTQTSMVMKDVKYNIPLQDEMFTERGLKK